MRRRLRLLWASPIFRAAAAVVVLAAAAGIAFWPRGDGPSAEGPSSSAAHTAPRPATSSRHRGRPAERAKAQLATCPQGRETPGDTEVLDKLGGLRLPCLGHQGSIDLGKALAGHTTVLNIWATYCQPCLTELPALQRYAERPGSARVLEVQNRTSPSQGLEMLSSLDVHLPSVYDSSSAVARALATPPTLPDSYVITPDGAVHFVTKPRVFTSPGQVAAAVERYTKDSE
jgi:thiol-disulfide isomerase/thioredoxin